MAEQNLQKTFHLKTSKGFTLIEVMIVLVILASVLGAAISKMNNPNQTAMSTIRNFNQIFKEIQFASKLQNTTYRMVIDMGFPGKEDNTQSYWIEIATKKGIQLSGESVEDRLKQDPDNKDMKADFEMHTKIIKEKQTLPSIVIFDEVELPGDKASIKEEKAYIYFLPQGLVTSAAIHINILEKKKTVTVNPLTGKGTVLNSYVSLKDIMDR